ncbi:MAG: serine hydrolase [Bacteroidetes bacterium]|nr:serine hydrolase [Bacteroidota bacterium]MBS1941375.1 serine hydrolase [Bacteroidota bacterium]
MRYFITVMLSLWFLCARSQAIYFPSANMDSVWATTAPATLGWCQDRIDSLYNYLGAHNTKAFIVLKDGRMVLEHYFGTFTQDSLHYWASAGKTLTSTVVGIAQREGYIDIQQPSSTYLGAGWTSETPAQEQLITVRNQLTMTSGLDDGGADPNCDDPSCLTYLADAGTRWAYHTGAYTLLQNVVEQGTGQSFSTYFNTKLRNPIGMDGTWFLLGENHVYFSTARSMARFGLLAMNRMVWANDTILNDTAYFNAATSPSQPMNPSYGYLWWLNGQPTYMLPGSQTVYPGPRMPDAPMDMYNGLGAGDQLLNISPSQGLVLVRMGNPPGVSGQGAESFDNIIWQYMNALDCNSGITETQPGAGLLLEPNPATSSVRIAFPGSSLPDQTEVRDSQGRMVLNSVRTALLDVGGLAPGVYVVKVAAGNQHYASRLVKQE